MKQQKFLIASLILSSLFICQISAKTNEEIIQCEENYHQQFEEISGNFVPRDQDLDYFANKPECSFEFAEKDQLLNQIQEQGSEPVDACYMYAILTDSTQFDGMDNSEYDGWVEDDLPEEQEDSYYDMRGEDLDQEVPLYVLAASYECTKYCIDSLDESTMQSNAKLANVYQNLKDRLECYGSKPAKSFDEYYEEEFKSSSTVMNFSAIICIVLGIVLLV